MGSVSELVDFLFLGQNCFADFFDVVQDVLLFAGGLLQRLLSENGFGISEPLRVLVQLSFKVVPVLQSVL